MCTCCFEQADTSQPRFSVTPVSPLLNLAGKQWSFLQVSNLLLLNTTCPKLSSPPTLFCLKGFQNHSSPLGPCTETTRKWRGMQTPRTAFQRRRLCSVAPKSASHSLGCQFWEESEHFPEVPNKTEPPLPIKAIWIHNP